MTLALVLTNIDRVRSSHAPSPCPRLRSLGAADLDQGEAAINAALWPPHGSLVPLDKDDKAEERASLYPSIFSAKPSQPRLQSIKGRKLVQIRSVEL